MGAVGLPRCYARSRALGPDPHLPVDPMPQDQPPRRKPYGHVTDEPNAFRAPHTPIPSLEATTEPPPAPMRKPPPKGYEGPRTRLESHRDESTLVGLAPPAERRPEPAN